jgi:LPS-assembly protein
MKRAYVFCILLSIFCAAAARSAGLDSDEPKTISAEKIEYDVGLKSVRTIGKTTITNQTGQSISLTDAYLGDGNDKLGGRGITLFLTKRTRITAARMSKEGNISSAEEVTYTACANCGDKSEAWTLSASGMTHDGVRHDMMFFNPVLWFYGMPVFWFPRMSHPDPTVKYRSGILMPSLNSTNNMGIQINLPLYVNFSDYHDMTLTMSYLTKENPLWRGEHRLNLHNAGMKTSGSYTHSRSGADRWHIFNNDRVDMGGHARMFLFLNRTSDKTYLQQYDFYNDQPYLDSSARLELFAESGYAATEAHIFQELRVLSGNYTNPSGDILPNIYGVYKTGPVFGDTYFLFSGDILGISKGSSAVQRLIGGAKIVSPWILPLGQKLALAASARYDAYNFINARPDDAPYEFNGVKGRFLPSGYVEWSLPFARNGSEWTHVIEPKARLTIMRHMESPGFVNNDSSGSLLSDAMLFSDNRLAGYDLWANGNYVDYGVNWSAFSAGGWSSEVFLGQSYDFYAPGRLDPNSGFHDGASDYVGRLGLRAGDWLGVLNRFRVSNADLGLRHLESTVRVGKSDYVEAGYIRATQLTDALVLDRVISGTVLGAGIGLTDRLSARANVIYNTTEGSIQRMSAGLYYDHPCYTMLLEYSKDGAVRIYADGENYYGGTRIRFQFALKLTEGK